MTKPHETGRAWLIVSNFLKIKLFRQIRSDCQLRTKSNGVNHLTWAILIHFLRKTIICEIYGADTFSSSFVTGVVVSGFRVRNGKWTEIGRGDPQCPQVMHRANILIFVIKFPQGLSECHKKTAKYQSKLPYFFTRRPGKFLSPSQNVRNTTIVGKPQ